MFKNISKMFSKIFHRSNKDEFSEEQLKKMKTYKEKKRKVPQGKSTRGWYKHQEMISLHNKRKKRKIRNRIARRSRQINRKAA